MELGASGRNNVDGHLHDLSEKRVTCSEALPGLDSELWMMSAKFPLSDMMQYPTVVGQREELAVTAVVVVEAVVADPCQLHVLFLNVYVVLFANLSMKAVIVADGAVAAETTANDDMRQCPVKVRRCALAAVRPLTAIGNRTTCMREM